MKREKHVKVIVGNQTDNSLATTATVTLSIPSHTNYCTKLIIIFSIRILIEVIYQYKLIIRDQFLTNWLHHAATCSLDICICSLYVLLYSG